MSGAVELYLTEDERFPDVGIASQASGGHRVEVDQATADRWRAAIAAYQAVQDEMQAAHDVARERDRREARIAKAVREVEQAQARLDEARGA